MSHTRYRVASAGEPRPFPPEALARIQKTLERYPTRQAALLPVLWIAQETFGWISKESAEEVARILELPPSHLNQALCVIGWRPLDGYAHLFEHGVIRHAMNILGLDDYAVDVEYDSFKFHSNNLSPSASQRRYRC